MAYDKKQLKIDATDAGNKKQAFNEGMMDNTAKINDNKTKGRATNSNASASIKKTALGKR